MNRTLATTLGILLLALGGIGAAHASKLKLYESCSTDKACDSGKCSQERCIPAAGLNNGRVCGKDTDCKNKACVPTGQGSKFKVCSASAKAPAKHLNGEHCAKDTECDSKSCVTRDSLKVSTVCVAGKLTPGSGCNSNSDCAFSKCAAIPNVKSSLKYCQPPVGAIKAPDYELCDVDTACASGNCGFASGNMTRQRCIPKSGLPAGSACAAGKTSTASKDCASGKCEVAGSAKEMACAGTAGIVIK